MDRELTREEILRTLDLLNQWEEEDNPKAGASPQAPPFPPGYDAGHASVRRWLISAGQRELEAVEHLMTCDVCRQSTRALLQGFLPTPGEAPDPSEKPPE